MNEATLETASDTSLQLCTFYVDNLFLGIDVCHVQEVIRFQKMTQVPLAQAAIGGLINLRGQIVTAVDLRHQLGLPPRESNKPPMNVIVRDGENGVSLLVDRIGDVVEVDEATFESPPATVPPALRELIVGAYKLPNVLLLVLDIHRAIEPVYERTQTQLA